MANTYTLISSNTLTGTTASVTFSSIPNTYTDLVLKTSIRTNGSSVDGRMFMILNGDTNTNYSITSIRGNGSTVTGAAQSNTNEGIYSEYTLNGNTSSTSTFSSNEFYIPNYTVSANKPLGYIGCYENNNATAIIASIAGLWRNTAAITSIQLNCVTNSFVSGSSFYLYGIKKN